MAAFLEVSQSFAESCNLLVIEYGLVKKSEQQAGSMSVSFKGCHYPKDVILYAMFFYLRYAVSYRDLEEIMAERGVIVDHATLNRWVVKFAPLIAAQGIKCGAILDHGSAAELAVRAA